MNLQEQLDGIRARFESTVPPATVTVMHRATEEIRNSGLAERILKVGQKAPEFALPNTNDKVISSRELIAKGPLAIAFFRGVWWPYCNAELEALENVTQAIEAEGATLVAISPQLLKYSRLTARKHKLTFDLLSDVGNKVARQFGLVFRLPDDLRHVYLKLGVDLEKYNGDSSWNLPMPGCFVIDQNSVIRYAEADPDYTVRPDPEHILDVLKTTRFH
jgi:peroxiredoxin